MADVPSEALCRRCVIGALRKLRARGRPTSCATMTPARPSGSVGWRAAPAPASAHTKRSKASPTLWLRFRGPPSFRLCSALEDCDFEGTSGVTPLG